MYPSYHNQCDIFIFFFFVPLPRRAMTLGVLRDPGSEVEDRQYQVDLQSINVGTALWEQLRPEGEGVKAGTNAEAERSSQNPALEWNMASRCGTYNSSLLYGCLCQIMLFFVSFF